MEKNLLSDALQSQKFCTSSYNTWAGECDNPKLRGVMMDILADEHCIQNDVFTIMKDKGFYQVKQADQQQITEVVTQLNK